MLHSRCRETFRQTIGLVLSVVAAAVLAGGASAAPPAPGVVKSARSGLWSAASTWEKTTPPSEGSVVLIRPGHRVIYDLNSETPIRSVHVGGVLSFSAEKDTRLRVGLIKIQPGEDVREEGFDCEAHVMEVKPGADRPALEVGTPEQPIPAGRYAIIQLQHFAGMDEKSCPAIVCCGGRMDFHGAPLNRTWVKLGATAKKGEAELTLAEPVTGWRVGDRIIVTATRDPDWQGGRSKNPQTEERLLRAIDGAHLTLDRPLEFLHLGEGEYRGEVANLSRNVVVETLDPTGPRGHTMYHRDSAGSISYAEFRHLGKENVLGRYALHYHLVGDTMRGSSVIGASIWDSHNRWLTIHGTNYLVVRDCVGYKSVGHGFFLEDGTEVYNVLDRNLAVQALRGKPLPRQVLPFDQNNGAGFWWANSHNTFTRNVSCENGRYGFHFEAIPSSAFNLTLKVKGPDGNARPVDIRTLPFVRFEGNEAHCDGLYGINLGEHSQRVGPDEKHPFVLRDTKIWEVHYAFLPQSPCVLVEGMKIHRVAYGVYNPNFDRHVYRDLFISRAMAEPFNRGHDDRSVQYGPLTVENLTFVPHSYNSTMPLIQISDDNPTGAAESHFRNVKVLERKPNDRTPVVNLGGGPRPTPTTPKGVPIYLHDWYGPGVHAKVVSTRARDLLADGNDYQNDVPLTGDESKAARVQKVAFPQLLDPIDNLPPTTVITHVRKLDGKLLVSGTTADNGAVKRVVVNGQEAKATRPNFAEWEITLPGAPTRLKAHAEDAAGNVEVKGQEVVLGR